MQFPAIFAKSLSEYEALLIATTKSEPLTNNLGTSEPLKYLGLKTFLNLFGYTEISLRLYSFLPIVFAGIITVLLVSIIFRNLRASLFIAFIFMLSLFANYLNIAKARGVDSKAFFELVKEERRGDDVIILWNDTQGFKYRAQYYLGKANFIYFEGPMSIPTKITDGKKKVAVNRVGIITTLEPTVITIPNYRLLEYNEVPPLKIIWLQKIY